MNPKIKELALQAGGSHYPEVGGTTLEKFAELIIRECIDIANDTRHDGKVVANRIKFVFGVE
jgi:hypothetical protein